MISRIRAGMVCINDQKILSIKQRDPKSGVEFWSLPGGGIEPTETAREAAVRETREETGYLVVSKSGSFTNEYEFFWNGQTYNCRTHWFKGSLAAQKPAKVISEADIIACQWLSWPNRRNDFNHNVALIEVLDFFTSHQQR